MEAAVKRILAGEVVAFPTRNRCTRLGADATNEKAVNQIFKLKGRPFEDPLIVHVADLAQVEQVAQIPKGKWADSVHKLTERFWPGPLTLVFKKRSSLSTRVTGGLDTVAVRVPRHLVALALIKNVGRPIAAPSRQ